MPLKIHFEKHRLLFPTPPPTLQTLTEFLAQHLKDHLPPKWALQYIDSDDDEIMLVCETGYQNFLVEELQENSDSAIVFIVPVSNVSQESYKKNIVVSEVLTFSHKDSEEQMLRAMVMKKIPDIQDILPKKLQKESDCEDEEEEEEEEDYHEKMEEMMSFMRNLKLKKITKKLCQDGITESQKYLLEKGLQNYEAKLSADQKLAFQRKRKLYTDHYHAKKFQQKEALKNMVQEIIDRKLKNFSQNIGPNVQDQMPGSLQESEEVMLHKDIRCNNCQGHPIAGIRYKCYVCPDFDFCEKCEATVKHPHPFIKLTAPEHENFLG